MREILILYFFEFLLVFLLIAHVGILCCLHAIVCGEGSAKIRVQYKKSVCFTHNFGEPVLLFGEMLPYHIAFKISQKCPLP